MIFILSPSARKWLCRQRNKLKKQGDKCSNCETKVSGLITESGDCVPEPQIIYDQCIQNNSELKDGSDCIGCGINSSGALVDDFSGNGIIISGKCTALPDAFAGKICVPESAPVNPSPMSYKRELISGSAYKYFRTPSKTVKQSQSITDIEISREDYIQAFIQTVKPCPTGQIKV